MFRKRLSWDQMFMKMADVLAERTACIYHQVGCIFVDDRHRIISVGYNGPVSGDLNCSEVGCLKIDGHPATGKIVRCNGIHSEINAILNCIQPERLRNSTLYITIFPCYDCMKALAQLGVKEIVFRNEYLRVLSASDRETEDEAWELAEQKGISIFKYSPEENERVKINPKTRQAE